MPSKPAFAALALLLSACATQPKPSPVVQAPAHPLCLPMASYSREEQAKAADELSALPQGAELGRFMVDYGALRAANRAACR